MPKRTGRDDGDAPLSDAELANLREIAEVEPTYGAMRRLLARLDKAEAVCRLDDDDREFTPDDSPLGEALAAWRSSCGEQS